MHRGHPQPAPGLYPASVPTPIRIPLPVPNVAVVPASIQAHVPVAPTSELPPPVKHSLHDLGPSAPPPDYKNSDINVLSQSFRIMAVQEETGEHGDLEVSNREFKFFRSCNHHARHSHRAQ